MGYIKGYKSRDTKRGKNLADLPAPKVKNEKVMKYQKKGKTIKNNSKSIAAISKQLTALKMKSYGEVQQRAMTVSFFKSPPAGGTITPDEEHPLLFMVNNLYNGSQVYRGDIVGTTPGFTALPSAQFIKYTYDPVIDEEYQFNARQSNDILSPARYLPMFTRINIRCVYKFPQAPALDTLRLRLTVFKLRPYGQNNNKLDYSLPYRLGAYRKMAVHPSDTQRNFFNPDYQTVMYDKWLVINNKYQETGSELFHSIAWRHPIKELIPSFNNHPTGQNPPTNFEIEDQIWCLISTDNAMGVAMTDLTITRLDSWRDHHAN